MTAKAKPATGSGTDGAKIGPTGDTLKIIPNAVDSDFIAQVIDTTGDGDTANAHATVPWAFVDKNIVISGWVVGGSVIGLETMGGSDTGVAITMTLSSGHTVAGNIIIHRCRTSWRRKGPAVAIVMVGVMTGSVSEAHT